MHNSQDKTALNTSREQFREPKWGVFISQLLSVCRDSKGHLSLHSWAGSQPELINSQHSAQALSPARAIWNTAVLLLSSCTALCSPGAPAKQEQALNLGCPQPGAGAALKLPGPGRVAMGQRRKDSCGNTPPFPCSVQTTVNLGNIKFVLGEW